jgi:hypothetical protein
MSVRGRAIGIIVATLLIGVAIGALIVGPLIARHHFRKAADWRTPGGFAARLEEIIRPDASQVDALRTILNKYGENFDELASRHRAEVKEMFDSLGTALDTVLTPEQKARLEDRRSHMGPPPGGPHGPGDEHDSHGPQGPGDSHDPGDHHGPP